MQALLFEAHAHCASGSNVYHGDAGNLAQERYGSGGTRVNLDYIYMLVTNDVLNVDHALNFQAQSHLVGVFDNGTDNTLAQAARRIYGNGVTAVYACTFNVFHDAGD